MKSSGNRSMKRTSGSVKKRMLLLFLAVFVSFSMMFGVFAFYQSKGIKEQIHQSNVNILQQYANGIQSRFEDVEYFIADESVNQQKYLRLEKADSEVERYFAANVIAGTLSDFCMMHDAYESVFAYCLTNDSLIARSASGSAADSVLMNDFINDMKADSIRYDGWFGYHYEGNVYMYYVRRLHDTLIGALISSDVLTDASMINDSVFADVALIDAEGSVMDEAYAGRNPFQGIREDASSMLFLHNEMMYADVLGLNNGYMVAGVMKSDYFTKMLNVMIWLLAVGFAVIAGFVVFFLRQLRKTLNEPLDVITDGIQHLEKGDFSYQIESSGFREFQQITDEFNHLGSEIENLKIDNYEKMIRMSQLEYDSLDKQLDTHFFINCLNNLRSLQMQGRSAEFEKMVVQLSSYIRNNFNSAKTVTLAKEMETVRNYVTLQNIRYEGRIVLQIDCDELIEDCIVPVGLLQTFAENAVKYGLKNDALLHIVMCLELDDDGIALEVMDDGNGYDPSILDRLNAVEQIHDSDRKCIGIFNLCSRLKIMFNDEVTFRFENRDGAYARIVFPERREG